jgi:hypothetical protein
MEKVCNDLGGNSSHRLTSRIEHRHNTLYTIYSISGKLNPADSRLPVFIRNAGYLVPPFCVKYAVSRTTYFFFGYNYRVVVAVVYMFRDFRLYR